MKTYDAEHEFIKRHLSKPVVAFIAGQTAPPGKRMGHAGAIISGGTGTAAEKIAAFEAVGVPVARIPSEIPALMAEQLERRRSRSRSASKNGARNGNREAAKSKSVARKPAGRAAPANRRTARKNSADGERRSRPAKGVRR